MNNQRKYQPRWENPDLQPWYRQFWPWFIIALPASVVVASFFTLWLAISNPDPLVIDDAEFRELKSGLKAEPALPAKESHDASESEPD